MIWSCGRSGRGEENIAERKSAEYSTRALIAFSTALGASSRRWRRCHSLRSQHSFCGKYWFVYHYPAEYKRNQRNQHNDRRAQLHPSFTSIVSCLVGRSRTSFKLPISSHFPETEPTADGQHLSRERSRTGDEYSEVSRAVSVGSVLRPHILSRPREAI
jgi:hypothetical protein